MGQLIRASIEKLQLEVGILDPVLSLPFPEYGAWVTKGWITTVWEFCSASGLVLRWDSEVRLLPSREHDSSIMQFCLEITQNKERLIRLNRVRCYLQVITVADIVTGNGFLIRKCSLEGRRDKLRKSCNSCPEEHPSA